jgi:hypothetical protein
MLRTPRISCDGQSSAPSLSGENQRLIHSMFQFAIFTRALLVGESIGCHIIPGRAGLGRMTRRVSYRPGTISGTRPAQQCAQH